MAAMSEQSLKDGYEVASLTWGSQCRGSRVRDKKTYGKYEGAAGSLELLELQGEKMPFHHVTAGLLYKGNYLNRSLSAGSDSEQLANISVEELDEIREAFRVLDRDGNGFISKQELGMAMRSLGYMPSEVELAIIMQRLDMDGLLYELDFFSCQNVKRYGFINLHDESGGDGQVDFDEFMTILGPKLVSSEGRDGFLGNTIDSIFWQGDKWDGEKRIKRDNAILKYLNECGTVWTGGCDFLSCWCSPSSDFDD
ncbi:hypothetical protein EI555_007207 [Monodon monoceros]|uniref:EF-hand domain-containing protein n=1 Tax=Monodon monoceros TaxID=40151 RepID=A0A4V5P7I2_MONMO|nr:hypothetical protein EI555_007207 [Monodon monoceros]